MTTQDSLKKAFAEELHANRKYLAFAETADQEGYCPVCNAPRDI